VRGNHDSAAIQAAVGRQKNARVLDNAITTVNGLTIAGIGDPEFTPDKSETPPGSDELTPSPLLISGEQLATTIHASKTRVGVAMVHDPAMAPPLSGVVPLVLAGHRHQREVSMLAAPSPAVSPSVPTPAPDATPGATQEPIETRLLVEGSTGGAGLRGLENEDPTPLTMSVLYFDENQALKAYDDIQLGGTGEQNVTMQRKVIGTDPEPTTDPSVFNGVTPGITPGSAQPSR